jgi:hypothetical protein
MSGRLLGTPDKLASAASEPPRECRFWGRWAFWRERRGIAPWLCASCVVLEPELEPRDVEWIEVPG